MNASSASPSRAQPFAERVSERRIGPCRLLTLRTSVRDVVTWCGSFASAPDMSDRETLLLQHLVVSMLDKGAGTLDRFAVADILESRGAELAFSPDILRIGFSGRALKQDAPDVLALAALQLREPMLPEEELPKAKDRIAASVKRSMENTGVQASRALRRRIYDAFHPNHAREFDAQLKQLQDLSIRDVREFHAAHFGPDACTIAVVGDVDEDAMARAVETRFAPWPPHDASPRFAETAAEEQVPDLSVVSLPDKDNADARLGHALSLRRNDPEYLPVFLANFALGGNFSARLMQTLRDELGLTYGVGSSLQGVSTEYGGHWQVAVTLSKGHVQRGLDETIRQIRRFVADGVTGEELDEKKTTITGSFQVGLSTTFGLAKTLLSNIEQGFETSYLDEFPDRIQRISAEEANETIARTFDPDALHGAIAGNIRKGEIRL